MFFRIAGIVGQVLAENITNRSPATREQIPGSFASLNTRWLTDVLCRDIAGARVTDFELGPDDSGSTNRRRICLQYNSEGEAAGLPSSLFIKSAMTIINRIAAGATGTMITECEFYNHIRPLISIEAPTARHAANDFKSCRAIILLEDLVAAKGAKFYEPTDYVDRQTAEGLVTLLAEFHGQFLGSEKSEKFAALPTWEDMFALISRIAKKPTYTYKGLLAAGDVVPTNVRRRAVDVWPATLQAIELGRRTPRTLAHGDVHIKNWYITKAGVLGLADWQCVTRGPLVRDLAYALSAALTVENRRNWEGELLTLYLDRLEKVSGTNLPFEGVFLAYRQQMLTALALWTSVLVPAPYMPQGQPTATCLEYIMRFTSAIDDLDTLKAVA